MSENLSPSPLTLHQRIILSCEGNPVALAVVTLHAPEIRSPYPYEHILVGEEVEVCIQCSQNGLTSLYPCATIQAIKKELR